MCFSINPGPRALAQGRVGLVHESMLQLLVLLNLWYKSRLHSQSLRLRLLLNLDRF